MSFDKTYGHTVLVAIDMLGAAVLFNQPDITISSLCWIARNAPPSASAAAAQEAMHLRPWQGRFLIVVGNWLERHWPGHCAEARQGDLNRGANPRALLT